MVSCSKAALAQVNKSQYGVLIDAALYTALTVVAYKYILRVRNPTKEALFHETTGRMLFRELNALFFLNMGSAGARIYGLNKMAIHLLNLNPPKIDPLTLQRIKLALEKSRDGNLGELSEFLPSAQPLKPQPTGGFAKNKLARHSY